MGWVDLRIGLGRFFKFLWVKLGRRSETAEAQKLNFFTFTEFIDIDRRGFSWVVGWVLGPNFHCGMG